MEMIDLKLLSILDWNAIAAVSSAVIALSALIFSVSESRRNQRNARLGVIPALNVSCHIEENDFVFQLRNVGIGPAVLNTGYLMVEGQKFDIASPTALMLYTVCAAGHEFEGTRSATGVSVGTIIPPGNSLNIFSIPKRDVTKESGAWADEFLAVIAKTGCVVIYRSLYEELFVLSVDELVPSLTDVFD